jgi:hypothetical protein
LKFKWSKIEAKKLLLEEKENNYFKNFEDKHRNLKEKDFGNQKLF